MSGAADHIMGDICAFAEDALAASPSATFALVVWIKGRPDAPGAVALACHPDARAEATTALRTVADATDAQGSKP